MFGTWFEKGAKSVLRLAQQVCLVAGVALVALTVTSILIPFAIGVGLLAMAMWAADREAEQSPIVVVPVGA
jgi:hypothetical protein